MRDLWYGTRGPVEAPIVLVGESWGLEEFQQKQPFVGLSGTELHRMLAEAHVDSSQILMTNMVADRPQSNETWRFFSPKKDGPKRIAGVAPSPPTVDEISRLYRQISAYPRRLVIGVGNWSMWALSNRAGASVLRESNGRSIPIDQQTWAPNGITSWRGSMWYCEPHPEFGPLTPHTPLLPIVHPAAIMRQWTLRAPTVHDLRARVPMALRQDWRPQHAPTKLAPPTFGQAVSRFNFWLESAKQGSPIDLAVDIETVRRLFISCIGFSDSPHFSMSVPFLRADREDGSLETYWTTEQEATLIGLIRRVLSHPHIRIIGQNFIYDTQYIQHWFGVTPKLYFDTMLAQNVLFPGTPKTLEYLSSLYCSYHWYWKEDHKDWDTVGNLGLLLDYNCTDVLRTREIALSQQQVITKLGQDEQMRFKMRTNDLCLRMMNRGVAIDIHRRGSLIYDLQEALTGLERELLEIIPQDFVKPHEKNFKTPWYRSPSQTSDLFYNILGMKAVLHRKTGSKTVGKEALMELEKRYPEFTALFRRLDLAGSVENTMNVCQSSLDPDGRMRCSYNPGGTETHRLSSSKNAFGKGTNLQNLTKGEEDD